MKKVGSDVREDSSGSNSKDALTSKEEMWAGHSSTVFTSDLCLPWVLPAEAACSQEGLPLQLKLPEVPTETHPEVCLLADSRSHQVDSQD